MIHAVLYRWTLPYYSINNQWYPSRFHTLFHLLYPDRTLLEEQLPCFDTFHQDMATHIVSLLEQTDVPLSWYTSNEPLDTIHFPQLGSMECTELIRDTIVAWYEEQRCSLNHPVQLHESIYLRYSLSLFVSVCLTHSSDTPTLSEIRDSTQLLHNCSLVPSEEHDIPESLLAFGRKLAASHQKTVSDDILTYFYRLGWTILSSFPLSEGSTDIDIIQTIYGMKKRIRDPCLSHDEYLLLFLCKEYQRRTSKGQRNLITTNDVHSWLTSSGFIFICEPFTRVFLSDVYESFHSDRTKGIFETREARDFFCMIANGILTHLDCNRDIIDMWMVKYEAEILLQGPYDPFSVTIEKEQEQEQEQEQEEKEQEKENKAIKWADEEEDDDAFWKRDKNSYD